MSHTRPEGIENHPLTEAARTNDALAEEHAFADAIAVIGLDLEAVAYVSHQRALRAVLLMTRGPEAMKQYAGKEMPFVLPMSDTEREYTQQLSMVLIDGIAIGWKAAHLTDKV